MAEKLPTEMKAVSKLCIKLSLWFSVVRDFQEYVEPGEDFPAPSEKKYRVAGGQRWQCALAAGCGYTHTQLGRSSTGGSGTKVSLLAVDSAADVDPGWTTVYLAPCGADD